jgi:glycosyltransferase involved in cell wall biosynthesis
MIATDAIGGPGKGLFQFLKHLPPDRANYVLCNFEVEGRPHGQFIQEAHRRRLNLMLLTQKRTIDPGLVLQARRIVREHGIDVVQTHGYKSHVIGFVLRLMCGTRWIAFAHGFTDDDWKIRLYNRIDLAVLRGADRVVTVSASTKALLVANGVREKKIRLIYNAIESNDDNPGTPAEELRRRLGIRRGEQVVGVIGRLSPEKGQTVFLRALARAARVCPDVKALLIGDGQDRSMLEDYCRDHGLSGRVIFTGYRENIADYYRVLDVLVLPSLSEGLPNTVLEAMSFGIPVIATRVGGVPEIIQRDEGVLVDPGDHDALADRMAELLQNESLRKTIGERGRGSLHPRFAPDHRARQILSVYDELLPAAGERTVSNVNV